MNKYLIYFLLLNIILCFSCDKNLFNVHCDDCLLYEPAEVKLIIILDAFKEGMYREPVVKVYEGNIEDSILVTLKTDTDRPTYLSVYVNKKYTATATYYYKDKTFVVVDSVIPHVKNESDKCNHPCYVVVNNKVNLQLRYT